MEQLVTQLGIDWRLLISQAVNFLLLLIVLRIFAYKPILKILHDRRTKIEEGLTKAKEADKRLHDANEMMKAKDKEADAQALALMKETETKAKEMEAKMLDAAREKEAGVIKNAELIIEGKAEEARRQMRKEAVVLVKSAIVKAVELDPKMVDEAMIKKAVEAAGRS